MPRLVIVGSISCLPSTDPSACAISSTVYGCLLPTLKYPANGVRMFEREHARLDDVVNADEVAALKLVLENQRGFVIEQPRRKNRKHACIRVR